jgi:hypothetical protein
VRLLNSEKAEKVSKEIHTLGARCRARLDVQLAVRHLVMRQSARLQARHVSSGRHGVFIFVRGPVNDSIDHWAKVVKAKIANVKIMERKSFSEIIGRW